MLHEAPEAWKRLPRWYKVQNYIFLGVVASIFLGIIAMMLTGPDIEKVKADGQFAAEQFRSEAAERQERLRAEWAAEQKRLEEEARSRRDASHAEAAERQRRFCEDARRAGTSLSGC
jgi:hypothetical protein